MTAIVAKISQRADLTMAHSYGHLLGCAASASMLSASCMTSRHCRPAWQQGCEGAAALLSCMRWPDHVLMCLLRAGGGLPVSAAQEGGHAAAAERGDCGLCGLCGVPHRGAITVSSRCCNVSIMRRVGLYMQSQSAPQQVPLSASACWQLCCRGLLDTLDACSEEQ